MFRVLGLRGFGLRGLGFRGLGFSGLGFRGLGFLVQGGALIRFPETGRHRYRPKNIAFIEFGAHRVLEGDVGSMLETQ